MTLTPKQKQLLIETHPDRHGGDHSRLERFFAAMKRPSQSKFARRVCRVCGVRIGGVKTCRMHRFLPQLLAGLLVMVAAEATPTGERVTLAWDPSPSLNAVSYRLYSSTNLPNWSLIGTATGTNIIATNIVAPTYFFVVAVDAEGDESVPSNTLGLLGKITSVTVMGQHAPTLSDVWITYPTPVYSGPVTNLSQVYRLYITQTNSWNTVSTP